jgi:hypothetical protein
MKIFPLVGESNNPIMFSNVDLPEPELPTIKTNSPCLIENDALSSALTLLSPSPYILLTLTISRTLDSSHRLHR